MRVPVDGGEAGLVTTLARPGMPLGSAPLLSASAQKRKAAQLAKLKRGGAHVAGAASDDGTPSDEGESSDEASGDGDAAPADRGAEPTPPATGDE